LKSSSNYKERSEDITATKPTTKSSKSDKESAHDNDGTTATATTPTTSGTDKSKSKLEPKRSKYKGTYNIINVSKTSSSLSSISTKFDEGNNLHFRKETSNNAKLKKVKFDKNLMVKSYDSEQAIALSYYPDCSTSMAPLKDDDYGKSMFNNKKENDNPNKEENNVGAWKDSKDSKLPKSDFMDKKLKYVYTKRKRSNDSKNILKPKSFDSNWTFVDPCEYLDSHRCGHNMNNESVVAAFVCCITTYTCCVICL